MSVKSDGTPPSSRKCARAMPSLCSRESLRKVTTSPSKSIHLTLWYLWCAFFKRIFDLSSQKALSAFDVAEYFVSVSVADILHITQECVNRDVPFSEVKSYVMTSLQLALAVTHQHEMKQFASDHYSVLMALYQVWQEIWQGNVCFSQWNSTQLFPFVEKDEECFAVFLKVLREVWPTEVKSVLEFTFCQKLEFFIFFS